MGQELAWRIEQVCFNAFPSLKQVLLGDWLIRFAPGISRRSNSANPLRADAPLDEATLATIAALYRGRGQPAIFRVPSIAEPGIDPMLAAQGYTKEGETC